MAKIQFNRFWWYVGRRAIIRKVLEKYLPKKEIKILDIGAGYGAMMDTLKKFGETETLEKFPPAVTYLKKHFHEPVYEYNFPEQVPLKKYDLITLLDVLPALTEESKALQSVHQLLYPDGIFILTLPTYPFLYGRHDILWGGKKRYSRKDIIPQLEEKGFSILQSGYFNSLLLPFALFKRISERKKTNAKLFASQPVEFEFSFNYFLNVIFTKVFLLEAALSRMNIRFPFGLSLLIIAKKS